VDSTHRVRDYLSNMLKLLADGQPREGDIGEVKYWLERLGDYKYAPSTIKGTRVFQPAICGWDSRNVILLGQRLKVQPWVDSSKTS
jgi:hypothetical protein